MGLPGARALRGGRRPAALRLRKARGGQLLGDFLLPVSGGSVVSVRLRKGVSLPFTTPQASPWPPFKNTRLHALERFRARSKTGGWGDTEIPLHSLSAVGTQMAHLPARGPSTVPKAYGPHGATLVWHVLWFGCCAAGPPRSRPVPQCRAL